MVSILHCSKALANRVSRFLSDDDQVKRFIIGIKSEEFDDNDSDDDYCDADSTLDVMMNIH